LTIASASWIRIAGSWRTTSGDWMTTINRAVVLAVVTRRPGAGFPGQRLIQHDLHAVIAGLKPRRQRMVHHPEIKLVADMGQE
jgi:hypothetical protein